MHFCSTAYLHRLIGYVHLPTETVFSVIRILVCLVFDFCFVCSFKSIFTQSFGHFPRDVCTSHNWLEVLLSRKTHDQLFLGPGFTWHLSWLSVVLDSLPWWGVAHLFICCSMFLCQISSALTVLMELKTSVASVLTNWYLWKCILFTYCIALLRFRIWSNILKSLGFLWVEKKCHWKIGFW